VTPFPIKIDALVPSSATDSRRATLTRDPWVRAAAMSLEFASPEIDASSS
jgi:hypothetical protein